VTHRAGSLPKTRVHDLCWRFAPVFRGTEVAKFHGERVYGWPIAILARTVLCMSDRQGEVSAAPCALGHADGVPAAPARDIPHVAASLCGEWNCSRSGEFQREPTEDRQISMKPDALNATDAEHRQRVVVLQPSELALDGRTTAVERLPLIRSSWRTGSRSK
jgi:hypothetical protein